MKESVCVHNCYSCHCYYNVILKEYSFLMFFRNVFFFFLMVNIILTESVHRHMQQYEVEYLQFAFRWMNNLLMRELPLRCTIRLWDTYQVHTHRAKPQLLCFWYLYISIWLSCCLG